ncbi:hypothetical protein FRB94_000828 [Tulasnella sp. JGI-2019a]|nr:hypothetical protein FRB94_000828 [Tulasnella sp. JGI-2019a]KAG9014510.1 hypothetical protein FRB93_013635 [Tulasnella sp. JGI-2019a]
MPKKRAQSEDDSVSADEGSLDASPPPAKKKVKATKEEKKDKTGKKKAEDAPEPAVEQGVAGPVEVLTNGEGEKYVRLSKTRRATARSFKGVPMVDLREFYIKKGSTEELPGSKGIALSEEQWNALKASISVIDECFESLKEKK